MHNRFWAFLLTFAMLLQSTPLQAYADAMGTEEYQDQIVESLGEDTEPTGEVSSPEEIPADTVADEGYVESVVDDSGASEAVPAQESAPQDQDHAQAPAETVSIGIAVENATVEVNGQQVAESGELTVAKDQNLALIVSPNDDFAIIDGSVVAIIDGEEFPLPASENGGYRISGESVHEGTAIRISAARRVYTYDDDNIKVTATLEDPKAIPNDATLQVSAITSETTQEDGLYNYDAYMEALNKAAEAPEEEPVYTQDNTLLYDVAFITTNPDTGEPVELQPEEGKVTVKFEFKQQQLTDDLAVQQADEVNVIHLPVKDEAKAETTAKTTDIVADDVIVEPVADQDFAAEGDSTLEIVAKDFSVFAVSNLLGATDSSDYTVVINIDPAGLNVSDGDGYYLFLKGKDGTSLAGTYYLGKLKIDSGQTQFRIPIQYHEGNQLRVNWQDGNGGAKSNARISNPNDVEVYLLKADTGQNISMNQATGQSNCSWLSTGTNVKNYGVEIVGTSESGGNVISTINLHDISGGLQSALTPEAILGDAHEFGITASRYEQTVHTETNFAVKSLHDEQNIDVGGSGTADVPFYVGSIDNGTYLELTKGTNVPAYIYVGEGSEGRVKVDNEIKDTTKIKTMPVSQINGYVDMLIGHGQEMSDYLASQVTLSPTMSPNSNKYTLDTTSFPDGTTIYVNADGIMGAISAMNGLRIEKLPNQSIVFNISEEGSSNDKLTISKFTVDPHDGGGEIATETDAQDGSQDGTARNQRVDKVIFEHISFNVINAQYVHLETAAGLFLCPKASYVTQNNGAGWILAAGTVHSTAEWHFYRHIRHYHAEGTFILNARKKLVDGNNNPIAYENRNFSFTLYEMNGDTRGKEIETATANGSNGEIIFKSVRYTDADVPKGATKNFTYQAIENIPPTAVNEQGRTYESYAGTGVEPQGPFTYDGIIYSGEPITVEVEAHNPGVGETSDDIQVKVKLKGADGFIDVTDGTNNVYDIGSFTNQKTSITTPLKVRKNADYPWGASDSFTFTLRSVDGAPMPDGSTDGAKTVRVSSNNATSFGSIKYVGAGTYKYTVEETVPANATAVIGGTIRTYADAKDAFPAEMVAAAKWKDTRGVIYDATIHNITVTVTNGSPMTLTVVDDADANVSAADPTSTFTNDREDKGSLKLRKGLYIDGMSPDSEDEAESAHANKYISYIDGTYYFEVRGVGSTLVDGTREVAITIENGKPVAATVNDADVTAKIDSEGYVEIEGMTPGVYLINELVDKNTNKDAKPFGTYSNVDATVASGRSGYAVPTSAKKTLSNNFRTGGLKIRKTVLQNGGSTITSGAQSILNGTYDFAVYTDEACTTPLKDIDGNDVVASITIDGNNEAISDEIDGLKPGTYWVKETQPTNGAAPTTNPVKVEVAAGETGTAAVIVTITNNLETGNFTIKKTVKSRKPSDLEQEFSFTVTLSDTNINGTFGDMDFANGVATFTLKDGESKTASDLPLGITYTAVEDKVDGFVTTIGSVEGNEGTGTVKTLESSETLDFTNTRETGDLVLSKVLISDRAADASQKFNFTITLSDTDITGTFGGATFANGVANVELIGNTEASITGLPAGITYTIAEDAATGFKLTGTTGDTGTISTTPSQATFTNARIPGELDVIKTINSTDTADQEKEFSFKVTLTGLSSEAANKTYNGVKFSNGVATFTLKGGETKKIIGLPTGVDYTVEEEAVDRWVTTKTGDTGTISTQVAIAHFTNTKDEGGLAVYKSVVSTSGADKEKLFEFKVTLDTPLNGTYGSGGTEMEFTDGVATFSLKNGEYKLATGLPDGVKFVVEELTQDSAFTTIWAGETEDGKTVTKDGYVSDEAVLTNRTTKAVRFTNSRVPGKITINKKVVSPIPAEQTQLFTFTITLNDTTVNGTFDEVTFVDGVATLQIAGGASKTITGLPAGTDYTVTEAEVTNFTTTATGDTGTITPEGATADFTNTRDVTDFTLDKTVVSDAAADADQEFVFTVTLTDTSIDGKFGDMDFDNGVAIVRLKGGEKAKATGLPVGVGYTVTEATDVTYETEATNDTGTFGDPQLTAAFTNTRKTGGLDVTKEVKSSTPKDMQKDFEFTVTLSDTTINGDTNAKGEPYGVTFTDGVATFTLKDGETKSIDGLPIGITYRVDEAVASGFNTIKTGAAGEVTTTKGEAHFTNIKDEGGLTVTKTVKSPIPADKTKKFTFTVTLSDNTVDGKYGEMTFVNGVATFELADGESKTALGLAQGLGYEVEEVLSEADQPYFTTTWEGATRKGDRAKISAVTAEVKAINTHKPGNLDVTKLVKSPISTDMNKAFEFTVTLSDTTINGTFDQMTFVDGVATFTLKANETMSAKGLPIGVGYTVEEKTETGYVTTKTGEVGTISETTAKAEFTNSRITTKVRVKKVWEDNNNQDGKRLKQINADLTVNGVTASTFTLSDENKWDSGWIEGLPVYDDAGNPYTYSWKEEEKDELAEIGYVLTIEPASLEVPMPVEGTFTTLTNTYKPETVDVDVHKNWVDNDNQDGIQPEQLVVTLQADGKDYPAESPITVTLTKDNGWKASVEGLDRYKDGKEIKYTWVEKDVPEGYTLTGNVINGYSTDLTDEHKPSETSASIMKIWDDADNQDNLRPTQVTVTLLADGQPAKWADGMELSTGETLGAGDDIVVTLTEANGWAAKVSNLPSKANGTDIEYSWEETVPQGYAVTKVDKSPNDATVTRITNTHVPEETDATVKKVWDDDDNRDGIRPATLQVALLADGNLAYDKNGNPITVTLTEADGWEAKKVEHLPMYKNGQEEAIVYSWTEVDLPAGYTLSNAEPANANAAGIITTLTNKHTPETTKVTIKKVWNDKNNQDKIQPATVTVHLNKSFIDETGATKTQIARDVTLSADNNWTATIEELPVNENGKPITYSWSEEVPAGYTMTQSTSGNVTRGFVTTMTNTHTPDTVVAKVEKKWEDRNNQDGIRPQEVTVALLADGMLAYKDGTPVSATLNADNDWHFEVAGLDKKNNGTEIKYEWTEVVVPTGYELSTSTVEEKDGNEQITAYFTTVTNTHQPESTEASVYKVWNDANDQDAKRPNSLNVTLLADGQPAKDLNGNDVSAQVISKSTNPSWYASVTNLPKYRDNGVEIEYTWEEDEAALEALDYTFEGSTKNGTLTTLTNKHEPYPTWARIIKVWYDEGDQDGKRPVELMVSLLANGVPAVDLEGKLVESVVLTEADGWKATVENLPLNKNGKAIEYRWVENVDSSVGPALPEGYTQISEVTTTATENGVDGTVTTLTNKYDTEHTRAQIKKVWYDNDDQDGIRPASLTVHLMRQVGDQEPEEYKSYVLSEDNNWFATTDVNELDVYADHGQKIVYSWTEDETEGYELTGTATNGIVTSIYNTHEPATTEASVEKVWDDDDNRDGIRPATLQVALLADGMLAYDASGRPIVVTLTKDDGWAKQTVTDLPKYKGEKDAEGNPVEVVYTWAEVQVPAGYTLKDPSVNGTITTLTNTHTPEEVNAGVVKVWNDRNDQDGIQPQSVIVQLQMKDASGNWVTATDKGGAAIAPVELNAGNGWAAQIAKLPKNDKANPGTAIEYRWHEVQVPAGYELSESTVEQKDNTKKTVAFITTVTNAHEPEPTKAIVKKTWDDRSDQDGKRPDSLKVNLLADGNPAVDLDGKLVETVVLTEDGEWKATVENLPKYKGEKDAEGNPVEIVYTWAEYDVPAGYTLTGNEITGDNETTLTNSYDVETTRASVLKKWDDANDQDAIRPDSLNVTLLADGQPATDMEGEDVSAVTLTAPNWVAQVANLPKYDSGKPIKYEWVEKDKDGNSTVPEGYTLTNTAVDNTGLITTLTNKHVPELTTASVKKVWDDDDNRDGLRPASLTVILLADGAIAQSETGPITVTLTEKDEWAEKTVKNLPKYKGEKDAEGNPVPIVYSWFEYNLPTSYTLTKTDPENANAAGITTTLTNTHKPEETTASVKKFWADNNDNDGFRPNSVTVRLKMKDASGELVEVLDKDGKPISVTLTEDGNWEGEVSGLLKYRDNGTEIEYVWREASFTWPEDHKSVWYDSWAGEYFYMEGNSFDLASTLYQTTYDDEHSAFNTAITNTREPSVTSKDIEKEWIDADWREIDDVDGKRPLTLTVELLADNVKTGKTVVLSSANNWRAGIGGLPRFKDGVEISYSWAEPEPAVPGYSRMASDMITSSTLTNLHSPETVTAKVHKVWDPVAEGNEVVVPDELTVRLMADGAPATNQDGGQITCTLNEGNGWSASVDGLPRYKKVNDRGGVEIAYTWAEEGMPTDADGNPLFELVSTVETKGKAVETEGKTDQGVPITLTNTELFTELTNQLNTGGFSVAKVVKNAVGADKDQKFAFEVTLSNTDINGTYGDMTFENGVARFELGNGEVATASNLPVGITYNVVETGVDTAKWTTTWSDQTGTIAKNALPVLTCTNDNIHGVLTVKKLVDSVAPSDHRRNFKFTVTLADDTINGTFGDMEFKNGVATFNLKDTESKSAEGLPVGLAYTVTETRVSGFKTTWSTKVVSGKDGNATSDLSIIEGENLVQFDNDRNTGSVSISKAVISPIPAEQTQEFTFTIKVTDAEGNPIDDGEYEVIDSKRNVESVAFAGGVATIKVKGKDSKAINDLPQGAKFEIVEAQDSNNWFELSSVTVDGVAVDGTTATGTVPNQKNIATAFTNKHKPGELDVTKTVTSSTDRDKTTELSFKFTVTLSDKTISGNFGGMTFRNGVATFSLSDGEVKSATGLPVGVDYVVEEQKADGWVTTKTGETGTIGSTKATAEFTNIKDEGGLIIAKKVNSAVPYDHDTQEFTFMVVLADRTINNTYGDLNFTNGIASFTLKDGGYVVATGLPDGMEYQVYETVNDLFVTEWSGKTSKDIDTGEVVTDDDTGLTYFVDSIAKDETKTVTAINSRTTGELEIGKSLISGAAADANQMFTFTVTLASNGEPLSGTFGGVNFDAEGKATITLKGGDTKVIDEIPIATVYSVTEAEAEGFELVAIMGDDTGVIKSDPTLVEFQNMREVAPITVSKRVISDVAADADQEFEFTISIDGMSAVAANSTYSGLKFTDGTATFTLKDNESKTIDALPVGLNYTITEADVENFKLTGILGDDSGTIVRGGNSVEFTNTREPGKLELVKKVVSHTYTDFDKVFTFRIILKDVQVNNTFSGVAFAPVEGTNNSAGEITIKHGETKVIEGLPVGVAYEAFEVNAADDGEFVIPTFSGVITADESGTSTNGKIDATNIKREGDLLVTKTVESDQASDLTRDFNFTVIVLSKDEIDGKYGDMYFQEGVAEFTLANGESKCAVGLPVGAEFTVIEESNDSFATYVDVNGESVQTFTAEGVIVENETAKPTMSNFTNVRNYSSLTVDKRLFSDRAADANQTFTFHVSLTSDEGEPLSGTFGGLTFDDNGEATFTLKGGESKTIDRLPVGTWYEVTEDETAGFILNGRTDFEDTISAEPSISTFTNSRVAGGFDVTKKVESPIASDQTRDFEFTVTLSDTSISGTYGDMTFANGVATFTLKAGETKTAKNLPTDVTYTVVETADEDFSTTWTGTVSADKTISGEGTAADAMDIVETGNKVEFTNSRIPGDLAISKTVVGDAEQIDPEQEFEFTVTLSGQIGTQVNGTFGDLTFKDGVATTTLKAGETKTATGLPAGVPYTVAETTVVGYAFASNNAVGTIPANEAITAEFTNYWPTGEAQLFATKKLEERDLLTGEFQFEIRDAQGEVVASASNAEVGEDGTAMVTFDKIAYDLSDLAATDEDGAIAEPVTYEQSKNFYYTIVEVVPDDAVNAAGETFAEAADKTAPFVLNGITYQQQAQEVTVNVAMTDPISKDLVVTYDGSDTFVGAAFANTYAPSGNGEIKVRKNLVGRAWSDGDEFTFTLTAEEGTPMPETTEIKVNGKSADHTESFGAIEFKQAGTYTYTVTETKGEAGGMSYDSTAHEIVFNVVDDGKGNLVAMEGTSLVQTAEVTNTYAANGKGEIKVQKTLAGRAWKNGDKFTFTISAAEGTPMPAKTSLTITNETKGHAASFGEIQYEQAGTYTYTVKETKENIEGVTYDETEHVVTINVVDDGTGNLVAAEGSSLVQTVKITNTYKPNTGDLIVRKVVSSSTESDKTRSYGFKVTLSDTTVTGTYGDMEFKDGVASFTLKHNESKTATGLPAGVTYKVEETDAGGLNSRMTGENGTITANKKASATCTNTRPTTPPPATPKTGDIYNPLATGMLAGAGLMLLALAILRRKREREA